MRLFFAISFLISSISYSQVNADSLIVFAKTQLGVKYKYTGISPKTGFDCSGFVKFVFNHFQIEVPRASMDYERKGRTIPLDSALTGDVIVFTGTNAAKRKPGHVGIITKTENGEIYFIHSSSGKPHGGVIITNYSTSSNYRKRYIKTVRLNEVIH
ncbi:MAG TPA: NlpC/P60 family protein [Bacteroidia bacterium]|nr:NlpC/P60 family protein [Bacteroidia bacterium]